MNYGKKLLISGIFLIVLSLAIFFLLFSSKNNFNSFRELKKNLVEAKSAETGGQEVGFVWDKIESRLEQTEMKSAAATGIKIEATTAVDDLNGDGQNEEYTLSQGFLSIKQNDKLIWRSPEEWWVDGFFLADANGDGKKEINLSVWKAGNFGSSRPFWVKKNDQSIKNHFFVMSLAGVKVKPLWQSSNLEAPNCEFLFSDIDADGQQELIVIEGEYNNKYVCRGKYLALWRWNGWGFANYWRSQPGEYKDLRIKPGLIMVNKYN